MLLVGALPNLIAGRSLESLTFEYRDYFIRLFVVFMVAHLFVRQTRLTLLMSLPVITLALQLGIDVYYLSEWYSKTFRVDLHELNAQLFVVPFQLAALVIGIYFCVAPSTRTTTRIFATIMMAGSIFSTLGFHLAIVNVSYKPVERIYADNLTRIINLEEQGPICNTLGFSCQSFRIGDPDWPETLRLDPQLTKAHTELLNEVMSSNFWVRRTGSTDHKLGLIGSKADDYFAVEVQISEDLFIPAYKYVYGDDLCPAELGFRCWDFGFDTERPSLPSHSRSVLQTISENERFLHSWVHAYDFDSNKIIEPALFTAGRRTGGATRLVISRIPQIYLDQLTDALNRGSCEADTCQWIEVDSELETVTGRVRKLILNLASDTYEEPQEIWVDKALSLNPVLYINRPEFLRSKSYRAGVFRIVTTPKAFSDTTLDIKISINLLIALFSTSWLTFGIFLMLFHTKRQLLKTIPKSV